MRRTSRVGTGYVKPMAKSTKRVLEAAEQANIAIQVRTMPDSTRTAQDAAKACGCGVAQIVKSLVFQGAQSGDLKLFLVSGANQLDLGKAAALAGEPLVKADGRTVRDKTGFAIGGVVPIGHLQPLPTWIDEALLGYPTVWAAAGAPNAVFEITPEALVALTSGTTSQIVT